MGSCVYYLCLDPVEEIARHASHSPESSSSLGEASRIVEPDGKRIESTGQIREGFTEEVSFKPA